MPRFLLFDTSTAQCHVGLGVDGRLIVSRFMEESFKHAEVLTLLIEQCMQEASWTYTSLDAVVITGGPGSYTGLRIGASVAKGICFASNTRLMALNTLQVMATGYMLAHPTYQGVVVPMIDARRMEVFTAAYTHKGETIMPPAPLILEPHAYDSLPNGEVAFIGDGASKFASMYGKKARFESQGYLGGQAMLALAQQTFLLGKFESIAYYRPDYHKDFYSTMAK